MRSKSKLVDGIQVFGVAGTSVVSFGITATEEARNRLLGFGLKRKNTKTGDEVTVMGYKVFHSIITNPTPDTLVSTFEHPIQSFVWDDYEAEPASKYTYSFVPMRLPEGGSLPASTLEAGTPVEIAVTTEHLIGSKHDIFFNRGVTAGQFYATHFGNLAPQNQPTPAKVKAAESYLSRDLDEQLEAFIGSAKAGDQLRCCFYEFSFTPALAALKHAIDRGIDVKIIVDMKVNESYSNEKRKDGTTYKKFHASAPRVSNLKAIADAGLPPEVILMRLARTDAIAHNKFMVLVKKGVPSEVWTGSTNLTTGGIYGQANVGHRVKLPPVADSYLAYWTLLSTDPGAPTAATTDPVNVAFRTQVEQLTPTPKTIDDIPTGVTALFSPRDDLSPLDLYVRLLAESKHMSCITFAFGIPAQVKAVLKTHTAESVFKVMLLEKADKPSKKQSKPFIRLSRFQNVYEAAGSAISTPIGKWVVETTNKAIGVNDWVSYVHLKFLLHDPLGDDPIVVTGSANFSDASTTKNDENMLTIRGDKRVADIYYSEFVRLWGHYYFRAVTEVTHSTDWQFLKEQPSEWLVNYKPGSLRSKRVAQYAGMSI